MYPPKRPAKHPKQRQSRSREPAPFDNHSSTKRNDETTTGHQHETLVIQGLSMSATDRPFRSSQQLSQKPPPNALRTIKKRAVVRASTKSSYLSNKLNKSEGPSNSKNSTSASKRGVLGHASTNSIRVTPATEYSSATQKTKEGMKQSETKRPTIARYVERFRFGVPTSPDDRENNENDFWWKSGSTSPLSAGADPKNHSPTHSSRRSQQRTGHANVRLSGSQHETRHTDVGVNNRTERNVRRSSPVHLNNNDELVQSEIHKWVENGFVDVDELEKGSESGYFHMVDELQLDDLALQRRADQVLARYASLNQDSRDDDVEVVPRAVGDLLVRNTDTHIRSSEVLNEDIFRQEEDEEEEGGGEEGEGNDYDDKHDDDASKSGRNVGSFRGGEGEEEEDEEEVHEVENVFDDDDDDDESLAEMYDSFVSITNSEDGLHHESSGLNGSTLNSRSTADENYTHQSRSFGTLPTKRLHGESSASSEHDADVDNESDDTNEEDDKDGLPMYASGGPSGETYTSPTIRSSSSALLSSSSSDREEVQHGNDTDATIFACRMKDAPMTAQELEQNIPSSPPPPPPPLSVPYSEPCMSNGPAEKVKKISSRASEASESGRENNKGTKLDSSAAGSVLRNSFLLSSCSSDEFEALDWNGSGSGLEDSTSRGVSRYDDASKVDDASMHDVSKRDVSMHDVSKHDVSRYDVSKHDVSRHDVSRHDVSKHDVSTHDDASRIDEASNDVRTHNDGSNIDFMQHVRKVEARVEEDVQQQQQQQLQRISEMDSMRSEEFADDNNKTPDSEEQKGEEVKYHSRDEIHHSHNDNSTISSLADTQENIKNSEAANGRNERGVSQNVTQQAGSHDIDRNGYIDADGSRYISGGGGGASRTRVNVRVCSSGRVDNVLDREGEHQIQNNSHTTQRVQVRLLWAENANTYIENGGGKGGRRGMGDDRNEEQSDSLRPRYEVTSDRDSFTEGDDNSDAQSGIFEELPLGSVSDCTSSVVYSHPENQQQTKESVLGPRPSNGHAMGCLKSEFDLGQSTLQADLHTIHVWPTCPDHSVRPESVSHDQCQNEVDVGYGIAIPGKQCAIHETGDNRILDEQQHQTHMFTEATTLATDLLSGSVQDVARHVEQSGKNDGDGSNDNNAVMQTIDGLAHVPTSDNVGDDVSESSESLSKHEGEVHTRRQASHSSSFTATSIIDKGSTESHTRIADNGAEELPVSTDENPHPKEQQTDGEDKLRMLLLRDPIYAALDARILTLQMQLARLSSQ